MKKEQNFTYLDDELIFTHTINNFTTPTSLVLFSLNKSDGTLYSGTNDCKIYSAKFYDSDALIRDYIPVLDKNKRPCLFDKVDKKCYYNQGTGEFLYG